MIWFLSNVCYVDASPISCLCSIFLWGLRRRTSERLIRVGKKFCLIWSKDRSGVFFFRLGDCIDVILHQDQGFFIVFSLKEGSEVESVEGA